MAKTKWTSKKIDALVSNAYRYLGQNVTIDVFDLSKISHAGRDAFISALGEGLTPDGAIHRMNGAIANAIGAHRKDTPGVVPSLDVLPLPFRGVESGDGCACVAGGAA